MQDPRCKHEYLDIRAYKSPRKCKQDFSWSCLGQNESNSVLIASSTRMNVKCLVHGSKLQLAKAKPIIVPNWVF